MATADDATPGNAIEVQALPESTFRDVPWRFGDVLIGIAPLALGRSIPVLVKPARFAAVPSWTWLPLTLLAMAWMLLYPLWVGRRRQGRLVNVARLRSVVVEALVASAVFPLLLVALAATILVLSQVSGRSDVPRPPLEPLVNSPNRIEGIALMVLAVSAAPVVEEVFFRGFLYNGLRSRVGRAPALLLQAGAFGLAHPFEPINAAAVAVVGLALGLLYEWRKSLLAPVFLHAIQNAVATAVLAAGATAYASAPVLGVNGTPSAGGCTVTTLAPASAADDAGLRVGDVIAAVDGVPVPDVQAIARIVRKKRVGDRISVEYLRDGDPHQVTAILKKRRE